MPAAGTDNLVLSNALEYAHMGLRVVILFPNSKRPRFDEWQVEASNDPEKVASWLEQWPDSNIGVQMGKSSGIIDIECDSAEAEKSLCALFGGSFPETPTFQAKRGKHRLFRWRSDLPGADKATHKIGEIDFKFGGGGKGSQSVFPPSIHPKGGRYEWLIHPSQTDFAVVNDETAARLWNHDGGLFSEKKKGNPDSPRHALYKNDSIPEGSRDDTLYAECCNIWREKTIVYGTTAVDSPDVQGQVYRTLLGWNRGFCSPPLSDADVRKKVESARAFIAKTIEVDTERRGKKLTALGLEWRDGEWWPGEWTLDLIETDPPQTRLFLPFHERPIELSMVQFDSAHDVHLAVLHETGTVCLDDRPGFWGGVWNGTKGNAKDGRPATRGLKAKLLDVADRVAGPQELKQRNVVAEFAWNWLDRATVLRTAVNKSTTRFRDEEGNVWFRFTPMFQEAQFQRLEFTRNQLSKAVRAAGAKDDKFSCGDSRVKLLKLNSEAMKQLEQNASGEAVSPVVEGTKKTFGGQ